jgi:prevent-host-death family protein
MRWALQDAKNRFSEVGRKAHAEGPQTVTYRGAPYLVVTAYDPKQNDLKKKSFVEHLLTMPEWGDDIDIIVNDRSDKRQREIDF